MAEKFDVEGLASEALKLRFEAHLEEYKALREGMLGMRSTQTQVMLYSLVLMGAAIPFISSIIEKGWTNGLLLVPPVFAGLLWFYYWLSIGVYEQGKYIEETLTAEIRKTIGTLESRSSLDVSHLKEVWQWERYAREQWRERNRPIRRLLGLSPAILIIFPALATVMLFVDLKIRSGLEWQWFEIGLLALDLVLLVVAVAIAPRQLRRARGS